jgi:RNA polymerase sigma-70 factor (ECF subfamily)
VARRGLASRCPAWLRALLVAASHFALPPRERDTPRERQSVAGPRSESEHARFEGLFARYSAPLHDYLYGMTRNRDAAADLVQETFLRAYAARGALDAVTYPQAWLYRIATNAALSAERRRGRLHWLPLAAVEPETGSGDSDRHWPTLPAGMPHGDDIAISVVKRDALWSVLAELPPRWRAVLLLQTQGGLGVGEIATLLELRADNVRKLLFRAKERFRALYRAFAEGDAMRMRGGRP